MILTFLQAKTMLARFCGKAGKCATDDDVSMFVQEVMQQLLHRGTSGNLKKWVFHAQNGVITLPADMELPIKVKIEKCSETVFDKWYEFYDQNTLENCVPAEKGLVEEPNTYFTQFDLPSCGARVMAVPYCAEDSDAHLVISGIDDTGKEVYYPHKGTQLKGEYLSINKNKSTYTHTTFRKIIGIEKTKTTHYVRLYWYCPDTQQQGLLAEYRPGDTHPSYRRVRVLGPECSACPKVTILGRVRLSDSYSDNDIIPITNIRALKLMAQQIQNEDNNELEAASYKNKRVDQTVNNELNYKRTAQATIDFALETSPGNIKNLI